METRYKRDFNHNYMILSVREEENYQLKMICNNKINGLLVSHTNAFNGSCDIYYDISSKQPLSRIYAGREMDFKDVCGVLTSLKTVLEEMKRYLLDSRNILFHPDFCYCNPEQIRAEWVCYPQEDSMLNLRELAEFFIDKVNHSDRKAVELAYGFYKMIKADNFSVKEIEDLLQKCGMVRDASPQEEKETEEEITYVADPGWDEERQPERLTLFEKIKKLILNKPEKEDSGISAVKNAGKREAVSGREIYGMEYPEDYNGETMVMGIQGSTSSRRLRSLRKGSTDCISLTKLPCVLGKMEECADVVLKDISVSRMHARIFEENGEIFLQDLNSKNGSYVNNLELESNEIVKLSIGDEIAFGNLRYIYE